MLAIYAGRVLDPGMPPAATARAGRGPILAAILCLWLVLITLSVHPHYLSYYNVITSYSIHYTKLYDSSIR